MTTMTIDELLEQARQIQDDLRAETAIPNHREKSRVVEELAALVRRLYK